MRISSNAPMRVRLRSAIAVRTALLALLTLVLIGCQGGPTLAPTPNLYADTSDNPFQSIPEQFQTSSVDVIYFTDRLDERESEDTQPKYGHLRSRSIATGVATMTIGENLPWEELVAASRTHRRSGNYRLRLANIDLVAQFPDTPLKQIFIDGKHQDDPDALALWNAEAEKIHDVLAERLAQAEHKEVLLFIHGYNNSFQDGIFRAAQLWHFMGRRGVPVAYSWPAGRGGLRGYTYDRESGEFTIHHLKRLLKALGKFPEIERVNIVSHSRGTDVATTALRELAIEFRAQDLSPQEELRLENLVLAAPDLDMEVFAQRVGAEWLWTVPKRFTIYLSEDDRAIGLASWLFASIRRLGQLQENELSDRSVYYLRLMPYLQVIDVRADTGFLGHGYFISNPAVLSDLVLLLRDDLDAGPGHGRPLGGGDPFWVLDDGYPAVQSGDEPERAIETDEGLYD